MSAIKPGADLRNTYNEISENNGRPERVFREFRQTNEYIIGIKYSSWYYFGTWNLNENIITIIITSGIDHDTEYYEIIEMELIITGIIDNGYI